MSSGASRRLFLRSLCFAAIPAWSSPLKPPSLTSETASADLVELYWRSLLLDTPFHHYPTSPLVAEAAAELLNHPGYSGPKNPFTLSSANLRTQRDLARHFHGASPEVPFLHAAPRLGIDSRRTLQLLSAAARAASSAAIDQKTRCNRPRPAAMAARLHEHITNSRRLPFPVSLTHSRALELSARATGSFLLGTLDSSNTPSFPNAHAAVASACATVLGHFSGTHAAREFEHLASAIALSRESAGLNFRSDTAAGLALGRSVAREILLSA